MYYDTTLLPYIESLTMTQILNNPASQRTTITLESVSEAAIALVNRGEKPTMANVRDELGGGSYSTISPFYKAWQSSQAVTEATKPVVAAIPERVKNAYDKAATESWDAALEVANERLAAEREALEKTRIELEQERDDAAEVADRATAELDDIKVSLDHERLARHELEQQLAQQTQALAAAQAALNTEQSLTRELRAQLDKELVAHTKTQENLTMLHEQLNSQARDLATAQAHLSTAKETENKLSAQLAKQADDLTRVKATAERTQASLDKAVVTAAKADDEAEQAKAEAKINAETAAELRGRVIELEKTAQAIQTLREELEESRTTAAKALGALEHMQKENENLKLKLEKDEN